MAKEDGFDRDQIVRNSTAIDFLTRDIEDLKEDLESLKSRLVKHAEELKDCYFLSDNNTKKLEELEDSLSEKLDDFSNSLSEFKKYFSEEQNNRRKDWSNYVHVAVTCIVTILALLFKLRVL